MYERPGQEWMQMIVVNHFSALYHAESGAYGLVNAPEGLVYPDGNGVCAVAAGKSISLRSAKADFPVLRTGYGLFCSGVLGRTDTNAFFPAYGKEGQKERKYEYTQFHAMQR